MKEKIVFGVYNSKIIGMELWNFRGKQNTITEALQVKLPEHAVISITGAGGKTALLFAWAHELAAEGKKVAVTTTTHMYCPGVTPGTVFFDTFPAGIREAFDKNDIVIVASPDMDKPGKVKAPPADVLDSLREAADVVLIEADGSRRMPLKWPAPWEPVVPEYTDYTVCVAGLSALGRKTADVVYRADEIPEVIKRGDTVDVNLMHKILSSRGGGQKGVRGDFRVFMNQVDDDLDRLAAAYRLQQIFAVLGIQSAWGSLKSEETKIAVILEAAGDSKRFGSNKLLHIMDDGRPMVASILDAVRPLDVYKKIIVTQYEEVAGMVPDFDIVINDRPDLGISHSMQLGIQAAGDADAYMFCVCDQPGLTSSTIEQLIEIYKNGTAGIVSLAWQGKMCNPKIFSSRYKEELLSLSGDTGGRQIISAHTDDLTLVEAASESEVIDMDRPAGGN